MNDWIHIPQSCVGRSHSTFSASDNISGLCTFPFIETLIIIIDYQQHDQHIKTLIHLEEFDHVLVAESIDFELNEIHGSELNKITMIIHEKSVNVQKRMRRLLSLYNIIHNIKYKLIIVPESADICGLALPLNGEPIPISTSKMREWISMPGMTEQPKYDIIRHPQELQFCLEKAILFGINKKDSFSPCIIYNGMHWERSASWKDPSLNEYLNKFMLSFDENASLNQIQQKMRSMFKGATFDSNVVNKACLSAKLLKNINQSDTNDLFQNIISEICYSLLFVLKQNKQRILFYMLANAANDLSKINMLKMLKLCRNFEKYTNFHQLMNYFSFVMFGTEYEAIISTANVFERNAWIYYWNNDFFNAKKCFWNVTIRHSLVYCIPSNILLCAHYKYAASCQNAGDHMNAYNYIRLAYHTNEKLLICDLQNIQLIQRKVTILRRLKQCGHCISETVEKGDTYLPSMINYKRLTLRKKKCYKTLSYKYPFERLLDIKTKHLNLKKRECEQCHKKEPEKNLKVCGKCKAAFFCSRHCQKISWKYSHKFLCVV